jgi:glucokinase
MDSIGFDVGGTYVKSGHLSEDGAILHEARWPTPTSVERLLDAIAAQRDAWDRAAPFGIACAGVIDSAGTVVRSPNLPGWKDIPLRLLARERIGRDAAVLNDANAFLLAEAKLGAARGARHAVGLTLGTGVGGAILLEGRLWSGVHGFAGEAGHAVLLADGPLCACGSRGCVEALVGTQAILERYRRLAPNAPEAKTPREISTRARAGDGAAIHTLAETGRLLGLALMSLAHLLDPEIFVIGGGVASAADLILEPAREALRSSPLLPGRTPPVMPAALGNSAGWIGAALAAPAEGESA